MDRASFVAPELKYSTYSQLERATSSEFLIDLGKAAQGSMKDFTQFYKQFVENGSFKRFVSDMVYAITNT